MNRAKVILGNHLFAMALGLVYVAFGLIQFFSLGLIRFQGIPDYTDFKRRK